jgi:uncharacterized membrane protein YccF (DUF307 family)
MKLGLIQILGIMLTVLIIFNFIFFILGRISATLFWVVIIVVGLLAFVGIPYLRKMEKSKKNVFDTK